MLSLVLLVAAVVFAVWAALIDAGHADIGAAFQCLALSLACGFAALVVQRLESR